MNPQETAKGNIVPLAAVAHDAPLVREDQLLLARIKRIVVMGNVILPEQLACLFGSIYSARPEHPLLKVAQEEVFRRFPELKEKADRIYGRGCFDEASVSLNCGEASA
ncbi:acetylornithine deacetylase/Succinyl-diaminopimelate desuccinylase [Acetobacter aceti NRIC 0242]|uniref:Uncharacterized protein n=1 Tax=Acetobacter aceti NBRC 14818 TaxID=887700 RepID=A0AB33IKP6_ACEAC|nr:hypothetical protein [Acetobacter aceti]TCS33048.1 hypothetical protein EDC15_109120 [Acetobacter aceti NBRC 14818]BCK76482.1 hypothetical protein EMQ_2088 [Acetobacter aceti NBRC 14818]GAN56222.1 hypothetical protein Abac_003_121 [Acetobacter aceti NBRC 14818]GBO81605.1 acetylornithine deacetylase/Succinyl-diaminopimelate desuccinylase [Acetobacter aceti NRIC 0242]